MEFHSLAEAAKYAHVTRQAIYLAIMKRQLKADKRIFNGQAQWVIMQEDLDAYRTTKYNPDKRMFEGKKLFDLENGRWSVLHAAKALSQELGRHYPTHHVYYLIRLGELRASKYGNSWVIAGEDLIELFKKEKDGNTEQTRFA